ncbi:calcium/sodium antiporter [Candidatus Peregrinibacteria bacterium]|nr:calcium/sodium antiporter [Candidatus Peregrinibacteria bacterium]
MEIVKWSALFIISLAVLIKSADYFTTTAEKIGLHFKIPSFIIGVTIVALGTSLPEIATSVISVSEGQSQIVIGNVVGSNLANILLVLAITAIIGKRLFVSKDIINIDLPILLGSTILLFITTLDGKFSYADAAISLLTLLTYILYNTKAHREIEPKEKRELSKLKAEEKKEKLKIKYPIILIVSGIFLYFSADFTIESVIQLSNIFKVGTEIIAVSAIAIGTSLPELAVSAVAAKKGKADIAIGNVTGSNIFNILGVMGIPALFGTLHIPPGMITFTIPVLIFVTILYVFVTMDKQITKWEGLTLLLLYIAFLGKTFGLI